MNSQRVSTIITTAVLLFVTGIALMAQSSPGQASAAKPDSNRELLNMLAGDWTVDVTYIIAGREQRGSAQMHAEWILDGHFLRQEYHAPMGARDFVTLQFLGYDPIRQKFTILKMDSMDDAMLYADGDLTSDRKLLTFVGDRSDMMTRATGRLRQVLTLTDSDRFMLEWFLTPQGGAESKTVTMAHARKMPVK
jgi:hypothetical protein